MSQKALLVNTDYLIFIYLIFNCTLLFQMDEWRFPFNDHNGQCQEIVVTSNAPSTAILDDSDGDLPEIKDVGKAKKAIKRGMQFRYTREDNIALFKEIENVVPFNGKKMQRWETIRENLAKTGMFDSCQRTVSK